MSTRGQYSNKGLNGRVQVGAFLVHTLELKQRFNNAKAAAVQTLLNDLASNGVASSAGPNRWEIAMKDGVWVLFTWFPEHSALEVTITDREVRRVDQMGPTRDRYEAMLRRITPRLQSHGATTVGAAIYAGQQVAQQPRFAARTRAIKAVFDMYTTSHRGARYYIYAEVNGMIDKRASSSLDEANSIFFALERTPGEVYAAIFDPTDPLWPGPAADVYHEAPRAPQAPQDRPPSVGGASASPILITVLDEDGKPTSRQVMWHPTHDQLRQFGGQQPTFYTEDEDGLFVFRTDPHGRTLEGMQGRYSAYRPTWTVMYWSGGRSTGRPESVRSPVGLTIYHSVGDRADAVKQMAIDWTALYQNLARQAGVLMVDPKSSSGYRLTTQREWDANPPDPAKVTWWKSYADPLFKQWSRFKLDQLGGDRTVASDYIAFAERFQTNWDVYEDWKRKLDNLRAEATKRGFTVDAPKPADLPTTVWADVGDVVQRGAGKVASGLGDVWNIVKYGAWAVLGIGAVVAISSVASNLRSGKDPGEKYVEMIREGRRPRTPRALPTSRKPQLALPPGEGA